VRWQPREGEEYRRQIELKRIIELPKPASH
jgi:hypothetical protein